MNRLASLSRSTLAVLAIALVSAGAAAGYGLTRPIAVPKGGLAVFTPSSWSCFNVGTRVECAQGDAFPYVDLTSSARGGVTVKVVTLSGRAAGHLTKTLDRRGHLVYAFTAN